MSLKLYFSWADNLEFEERKLNILRIFLGLVLFWRQLWIATAATYLVESDGAWATSLILDWALCVLWVMFSLGLFTPIVGLVLSLVYVWYSINSQTYNLGPMIGMTLLYGMMVLGVGRKLSVDSLILARTAGPLKQLVRWNSKIQPIATLQDFSLVRLIQFAIYAMISFAAVIEHLKDPYWTQGKTVLYLATNCYFATPFEFFRSIYAQYPTFLVTFSIAAIVVQTIFQLGMFPLALFWRWGFWGVLLQGIGFFLFSAAFINISILPLVELILWYFIFFNRPLRPLLYRSNSPSNLLAKIGKASRVYACAYSLSILISMGAVVATHAYAVPPSIGLTSYFQYVGLWHPNVFNSFDLRTGDRWAVIKEVGTRERVVPFTSMAGGRLWYHYSDLIYFRTLRWRRSMIGVTNIAEAHQPGQAAYNRLYEVALFDYSFNHYQGPVRYSVDIYETCASRAEPGQASEECYKPHLVYSYNFEVMR